MLDGEGQAVLGAAEIEVTVAPGVKLRGAAEGLSGAGGGGFAGMVDENDGGAQGALELAEEVEERGDLGRGVLVDAMETDEGIEDEEPGAQCLDGAAQAVTVGRSVEAERRSGDDVDVERIEGDAGSRGDAGGGAGGPQGARPRPRRAAQAR